MYPHTLRTNLKQTIAIIKMEISPKRKDKLTVVLNNEGVKSFIVISVALKMALNAIVSVLCCEIDENCRGGCLFVINVAVVVAAIAAAAAAENRNSIEYS